MGKVCVKGESNPQLNLGRVPCYHYTIDAFLLIRSAKKVQYYTIDTQYPVFTTHQSQSPTTGSSTYRRTVPSIRSLPQLKEREELLSLQRSVPSPSYQLQLRVQNRPYSQQHGIARRISLTAVISAVRTSML